MPTDGLRIRYRRSGGFAGIDLAAELLVTELPEDEAGVAVELLAHPLPAAGAPPAGALPDQFSYQLHLDDGQQRCSYEWAEREVPDHVRPLLSALNGRAVPARPE